MKIRDRIKELRRVKSSELLPNPKNWRTHPKQQQDVMKGVLAEIGFADASLAFETAEGLMLLDGHLRAEIAPDAEVPVLILDVTPEEASKILATHDSITAMAGTDKETLDGLLNEIKFESEAVQKMLSEMAESNGLNDLDESEIDDKEVEIKSLFQVVIECDGEEQQEAAFNYCTSAGYKCKVLTL